MALLKRESSVAILAPCDHVLGGLRARCLTRTRVTGIRRSSLKNKKKKLLVNPHTTRPLQVHLFGHETTVKQQEAHCGVQI